MGSGVWIFWQNGVRSVEILMVSLLSGHSDNQKGVRSVEILTFRMRSGVGRLYTVRFKSGLWGFWQSEWHLEWWGLSICSGVWWLNTVTFRSELWIFWQSEWGQECEDHSRKYWVCRFWQDGVRLVWILTGWGQACVYSDRMGSGLCGFCQDGVRLV